MQLFADLMNVEKTLPMLPLSNVSPTASTRYMTGVLFCRAVATVVQPAGPAAFPSLP